MTLKHDYFLFYPIYPGFYTTVSLVCLDTHISGLNRNQVILVQCQ